MDIRAKAHELSEEMLAWRRDFHAHPELSNNEFRTTEKIVELLESFGCDSVERPLPTGAVALIKGGKPGKCIALRADIDALTTTEKTGLPYASENEGYMHACGHDTHTAMLLGAAKILSSVKDELCGTVKLIFQPAEELASGAKCIVEQGVLDGVDAAFGQHIFSRRPAGSLSLSEGTLHPAADYFKLTVTGKASHGALPDEGIDATVAASAIVLALQTISSREFSPLDPIVVTVGTLHSGARFNIISGEAVLEGTVRIFNKDIHPHMPEIMERIAKQTAAAYRCTAELDYQFKTESLVNEPHMTALARAAAEKLVPGDKIQPFKRNMGGEDFAEYTAHIPCAFVSLGGGGEAPQHSDMFCIDESAMEVGTALYAQVAVDYLNS